MVWTKAKQQGKLAWRDSKEVRKKERKIHVDDGRVLADCAHPNGIHRFCSMDLVIRYKESAGCPSTLHPLDICGPCGPWVASWPLASWPVGVAWRVATGAGHRTTVHCLLTPPSLAPRSSSSQSTVSAALGSAVAVSSGGLVGGMHRQKQLIKCIRQIHESPTQTFDGLGVRRGRQWRRALV